jgi:hypothetical protein
VDFGSCRRRARHSQPARAALECRCSLRQVASALALLGAGGLFGFRALDRRAALDRDLGALFDHRAVLPDDRGRQRKAFAAQVVVLSTVSRYAHVASEELHAAAQAIAYPSTTPSATRSPRARRAGRDASIDPGQLRHGSDAPDACLDCGSGPPTVLAKHPRHLLQSPCGAARCRRRAPNIRAEQFHRDCPSSPDRSTVTRTQQLGP